jgi:repressor LexA
VNTAEPLGDLTPIQREILKVIRRLTRDRRRPPCMREVLENVDLDSLGALSYQYGRLEARGYIRWEAGRPRTVEVRLPGEPAFPSEAGEPEQLPWDTGPEADETPADTGPEADETPADTGPGKVVWVPIAGRIAAGGF